MSLKPLGVGLIGSGMISQTYLDNMCKRFDILDVKGCSDIIPERSAGRAAQYGIKQMTNEEIFADPEIKIVMNTTYPKSHYDVTKQALEAGKHVQCEKMLATTFDEAKKLYALAQSKGLRFGAAPDTFLGAGYQTARKLIDDGFIGRPLVAHATIVRNYGVAGAMEPNPPMFVMNDGGTIPFDMGGYYIHALVHLLGPVKRVSGFATHDDKYYTHPKHAHYGEVVDYTDAPNRLLSSLEFESGVFGSLTACDSVNVGFGFNLPHITVYGTRGILICPDPNTYGGPVSLLRTGEKEFIDMPLTHGYSGTEASFGPPPKDEDFMTMMWKSSRRGIGVADMAWAITNNRAHRCSAELGMHALEIIHGTLHATKTGEVYTMTTHPEQPAAIPAGFTGGDAEGCFDTK